MKAKNLVLLLFLSLSVYTSKAQTFKNGDFDINAGFGIGYTYGLVSGVTSWPALVVSAEKGIKDLSNIGVLSVGGTLGYKHISWSDADYNWNDLYIGARGAIHFSSINVDKLDLYGGVSLGLRFYSDPVWNWANGKLDKSTSTTAFFGIFGGAKYMFSQKIGAFGELGYDISWLKLGVTFKL